MMSKLTNTNDVRREDLRLAFFFSSKELSDARSLLSKDEEFKDVLWDDSPPISLVMPSRAIPLLKNKGFNFQVKEPVMEESLTQKQWQAWKEDKAILFGYMFWGLFEVEFFLERVSIVREKGEFYVKTQKA